MISKRSYGRLTLAALMLFAMTSMANAQSYYAVEVVVFANPGGYAQSAEAWRPEPGMPDTSRARPVSAGGGVAPVSPSAYRLSGAWQALRDSPGYRPLRHVAWTQRGTSRSNAPVVLVGDDPDSPVYGTVTVSRGRFLHVDVDLIYRDGENKYRFRSHRRMRSNEIHYMDHPMFGVLVVITPLSG
jgi:hypothetical protein